MTFRVELGTGWAVIRLSGDIDAWWVHTHRDSITKFFEDCPPLVVVDLEPVTFMDSNGLSLLVRCVKASNDNQGQVVLASPHDIVRKVIEIVVLDQFVTVVDACAEQVIRDMPTVDDVL